MAANAINVFRMVRVLLVFTELTSGSKTRTMAGSERASDEFRTKRVAGTRHSGGEVGTRDGERTVLSRMWRESRQNCSGVAGAAMAPRASEPPHADNPSPAR